MLAAFSTFILFSSPVHSRLLCHKYFPHQVIRATSRSIICPILRHSSRYTICCFFFTVATTIGRRGTVSSHVLYLSIATTDRCIVHDDQALTLDGLDDVPYNTLHTTYHPLRLVRSLQLLDACAPTILRDTWTTDHALFFSHARIDIDISRSDEQWTV